MKEGQASPRAWEILDEIRLAVQDLEVRTGAEEVLYQQGLQRVHDLADARRARLVDAEEGIPSVHTLMVAALAGIIALALFTVGTLDYPFGGGVQVGPEAFELILERFGSSSLSDL